MIEALNELGRCSKIELSSVNCLEVYEPQMERYDLLGGLELEGICLSSYQHYETGSKGS